MQSIEAKFVSDAFVVECDEMMLVRKIFDINCV